MDLIGSAFWPLPSLWISSTSLSALLAKFPLGTPCTDGIMCDTHAAYSDAGRIRRIHPDHSRAEGSRCDREEPAASAAPRFCSALPGAGCRRAGRLCARGAKTNRAAGRDRQEGPDGTRPAGGEGKLGVDPSRPHPPRRTWPRSRARVFPPLAPQPPRRSASPPAATAPPLAVRIRRPDSASASDEAAACARRCRRPVAQAQAERTTPSRREPCPHRMITNGETKRPKKKIAKPFAAFWVGITSQATSERHGTILDGERTHARAHPINTDRESKAGAGLEQIIPPRVDLSYVLVPPNCSE
jgi:hypothetical protein